MILVFVLGIAAGCGPADPVADDPDDPDDPPDEPTRLVIAQGTDIRGFDIHDHNHTATEAVHINIFDYLVQLNERGDFDPALARDWEIIDELTWRFYLEEGVLFHNGDEFTAHDVKWTLERVAYGEDLLEYGAYRQIKEVVVHDDYTLDIVTHEVQPVLLNRLSRLGSGMLPAAYIQEVGWDGFTENPVGTGPYKVVSWVRDDRLTLEAFDDHWRGRPEIDEVVHRAIPEDSTRVAELITGGVDIAVNIPPEDWDRLDADPDINLTIAMANRVMLLELRCMEGYVTSDPRVRAAMDYAIDNQLIIDSLLGGAAIPTRWRVTPGNFGYKDEYWDAYVHDPDKARELLAEAGFPDGGVEITLQGPIGRYLKDTEVLEMIGYMLEQVGFVVDLQLLEWSAYMDIRSAHTHGEAMLIGYGNSLFDAALALGSLHMDHRVGSQRYGWVDPEISALIDEAEIEMDRDRRRDLYHQILDVLVEERPQIALFKLPNAYGIRKGVDFEPRVDEQLPVRLMRITR